MKWNNKQNSHNEFKSDFKTQINSSFPNLLFAGVCVCVCLRSSLVWPLWWITLIGLRRTPSVQFTEQHEI